MTLPRAAGLALESLNDLRLALDGLADEAAIVRHDGASSIAWTAAHVTQGLDSLVLYRFAGRERDPLLGDTALGAGGTGTVTNWPALRSKIAEVQSAARDFVATLTDVDLGRTVPYDGSIAGLRPTGINLEYALLRVAAHHFTHAGEIAAIRFAMGLAPPDNREWGRLFL
ncbi:MAG: DinB family protein [Dehalococcoidia bacterium]